MAEWMKIDRNAFDFKTNKELVGKLKEIVPNQFGGNDFLIEKEGGETVLVFGKTALQSKMAGISIGKQVKMIYVGQKKSDKTGRTYEDYEVFVKG